MTAADHEPALRTAVEFFAAVESARWDDAAALVDSELAIRFRETELAFVLAWVGHRDAITASRLAGEGNVAWSAPGRVDAALLSRYDATPLSGPGHINTVADLAALSPRAFVAACLEARNGPFIWPDGTRVHFTRPIVGGVREGEMIFHVLYRLEGPGVQQTDPLDVEVIRTVRSDSGWQVDPMSLRFGLASAHPFTRVDDISGDADAADTDSASPDA